MHFSNASNYAQQKTSRFDKRCVQRSSPHFAKFAHPTMRSASFPNGLPVALIAFGVAGPTSADTDLSEHGAEASIPMVYSAPFTAVASITTLHIVTIPLYWRRTAAAPFPTSSIASAQILSRCNYHIIRAVIVNNIRKGTCTKSCGDKA
eukprot:TRINITY_DN1199_c0_g1_i2.p2 TRINITY_DN1199_c0_g1~~TRINITY_DN1199_c0_g1_i2.p2  ORF type:complete len:149 (+),score=10.33 TRINITY_DN1199_c0_g1_i2:84-530(+)